MLTIILFALLATTLLTAITAVASIRRERKELVYSSHLLTKVMELEKELEASYDYQSDLQADIADLNQQLQAEHHSVECYKLMHETELTRADALADEILSNKESSNFLLESYQEDLDVAQECIWAKEKKIGQLQAQTKQAHEDLQVLIAKLDKGELTPNELAYELSWISATLTQDEVPF